MDARHGNPYLAPVMLRRLLTLAAILSGLAAIAAPAEARVAAVEQVRIAAVGEHALQAQAQAPAHIAGQLQSAVASGTGLSRSEGADFGLAVPAVQTGIDRARE